MFKPFSFLTLFICLSFISHSAFALSCAMPDVQRSASGADTIFAGHVLKIEHAKSGQHINKVTILVETPIKNATKGQEITVYQRHWLKRENEWEEGGEALNKRRGLFLLHKNNAKALNLEPHFPEEIYFVGMCGALLFADTRENISLVEKVINEEQTEAK